MRAIKRVSRSMRDKKIEKTEVGSSACRTKTIILGRMTPSGVLNQGIPKGLQCMWHFPPVRRRDGNAALLKSPLQFTSIASHKQQVEYTGSW